MIIGNGDIASVLNDRDNALFFVSGVSNSSEMDERNYQREVDLLNEQDTSLCIFYISTISINYLDNRDNRYVRHKIYMEELIKSKFKNYNIIRIGNITWGNNPHTFINYIRNKMKDNKSVLINDEYRFILNVEQLLLLTDNLPLVGKNEISAFGSMKKVKDII